MVSIVQLVLEYFIKSALVWILEVHVATTWQCGGFVLPCFSDSFFVDEISHDTPVMVDNNDDNTTATSSVDWYALQVWCYKSNLKLGYLNINSIQNKLDEVKNILNRNIFHILFLAETKIDSSYSDQLLKHPGYRIILRD